MLSVKLEVPQVVGFYVNMGGTTLKHHHFHCTFQHASARAPLTVCFLLCILQGGSEYLCEMQLNLVQMLEAKEQAHHDYEIIRRALPEACKGTAVDASKLEAFISGRLNNSALDGAVAALSAKADGLFLYAYLLAQHLDGEAAAGREICYDGLDTLPAGLADVYTVNFHRAFPAGAADSGWAAARPLIELIAAAMQPISVTMAAAVLGWDSAEQERALELTALLFPVRDGLFHVFHKTIIDWLTGEIAEGSSLAARSAEFRVERRDGHARFAEAFVEWLETRAGDATDYWLQHGVVHLCRAGSYKALAVDVFAADLAFLQRRLDAGYLSHVSKDFAELRRCEGANVAHAAQTRSFVGKYRDVLQREGGAALAQLAAQQPDDSIVCAAGRAMPQPQRLLKWRSKPQQPDALVATLAHDAAVGALAVSPTHIVGGAGKTVYVYDAATEELIEALEGTSDVRSVAIFEGATAGWIMAGCEDRTIKVWDAGER